MKDIDKMSSNELRAEVRVLRAVIDTCRGIRDLTLPDWKKLPEWKRFEQALAAVEAQG